jgi:hypothetical protein
MSVSGMGGMQLLGISFLSKECPMTRVNQMVSFQTKNPNLSKFWWALDRKLLIYI